MHVIVMCRTVAPEPFFVCERSNDCFSCVNLCPLAWLLCTMYEKKKDETFDV